MWRPSCDLPVLQARAALLSLIRNFFHEQSVLEVQTALLSRTTVTEPNLRSISVPMNEEIWYLQTSPEHQMKRLLASGVPGIYQICPAFRQEERGRFHNPEFTLVEWYRQGFSLQDLMREVAALVTRVLPDATFCEITYEKLFRDRYDLNPHLAESESLRMAVEAHLGRKSGDVRSIKIHSTFSRRELIDLLFNNACEGLEGCFFITEFPADQAALARTHSTQHGYDVADRFELVINGLELANGYLELLDPAVAESRMADDLKMRVLQGLPEPPSDVRLLEAMKEGLPDCSGVALGFDRLLMQQLKKTDIGEVLSFSWDRA